MANNVVGSLIVNLGLETGRLNSDTKKAAQHFNSFDKKASRSLKNIQGRVTGLGKSVAKLTGLFGVLSVAGLGVLATGLIKTNAEFQNLKSSLKTVTGSAEAASEAFDLIEDFATTTPFELDQVVQSFIKLKALGLDPSEEALRAYGNTASALGKSLDQMIEAVADAATGEFERLKEFGIKAKKQGDEVTFIFQGVSTTIGNSAKEIEGFLQGIGNNQFGTAMADQMQNLAPAFSNLNAAFKDLQVQIGDAGINKLVVNLTHNFTDFINAIDSNEIERRTKQALGGLADMLEVTDKVVGYFNSRDYLVTTGILGYVMFGKKGVAAIIAGQVIIDGIANTMASMAETPSIIVDPTKIDEAREKLIHLQEIFDIQHRQRKLLRQEEESANEKDARLDLERQKTTIMGMETLLMSGRKITSNRQEERSVLGDIVAMIRLQAEAEAALGVVEEESEKRRKIRSGFTAPTEDPVLAKTNEALQLKVDALTLSLMTEEQRLQESLIRRQGIVADAFENGLIEEEARKALMLQLESNFESKLTAITNKGLSDRQKFQAMSSKDQTKTVLGEMINMTQGVAQHSKSMFKINKTASLANALLSGYESFNKTMAAYPYPWNIGLAALGAAATGAQISAIKSTSFSGGGGGTTPSAAGSAPTINDIPLTDTAGTPSLPTPTTANITIVGGLHDSQSVRELIESINDELGDGVQLNVTVAA